MPAIQLSQLRRQTADLAEKFTDPRAFVRALNSVLDYYADRVHHPGQAGEPPPLLPAYYVPKPVLHQILVDLTPKAITHPDPALSLCDILWDQPSLEPRWIAITLLGQIPVQSPEAVLKRLQAWALSTKEERLLTALAQQGLERLRREAPLPLLQYAEKWLDAPEQVLQILGLRTLLSLLAEPEFENIPALFKLLTPFVRVAPLPLQPYIRDVLIALGQRSPRETAYFLRQNLRASESPDTPLLIRQTLQAFPQDIQVSLRTALRTRNE